MRFLSILLLGLAVSACGEPPEPVLFAIVADPHVAGRAESERRLAACVEWINGRVGGQGEIELVFVLGDVGWGKGRLARAKEVLDDLAVPYVPVLGDNEVTTGYEADFEAVFAPHYASLADRLEDWRRAATPVRDPATGKDAWLQNFAFSHEGVRFIGLDWTTRGGGESADLHDFPGGTLPFLAEELERSPVEPRESVVLLSHLPMHRNIVHEVFDPAENDRLQALVGRYGDRVSANYAGHYHFAFTTSERGGYEVVVSDATWDDDATVTVVRVGVEAGSFVYHRAVVRVNGRSGMELGTSSD